MSNKVLALKVATDGVHGEGFSVAAIVFENGNKIAQFDAIAEPEAIKDDWTRENILPVVKTTTQYNTRKEMRDAFWDFWLEHQEDSICVTDSGFLAESKWMQQCVADDEENRIDDCPSFLHELATLLMAKGLDVETQAVDLIDFKATPYEPIDEAFAIGLMWNRVMAM